MTIFNNRKQYWFYGLPIFGSMFVCLSFLFKNMYYEKKHIFFRLLYISLEINELLNYLNRKKKLILGSESDEFLCIVIHRNSSLWSTCLTYFFKSHNIFKEELFRSVFDEIWLVEPNVPNISLKFKSNIIYVSLLVPICHNFKLNLRSIIWSVG